MAGNSKPKKKYVPLERKLARARWKKEGKKTVDTHESAVDLRNQNHAAMDELVAGRGTREHLNVMLCMLNTMLALTSEDAMGKKRAHALGSDHLPEIRVANQAIFQVGMRAVRNGGRYLFTGPEIKAVNHALDVHDLQLNECTIAELEKANRFVDRCIASGAARKIPKPQPTMELLAA